MSTKIPQEDLKQIAVIQSYYQTNLTSIVNLVTTQVILQDRVVNRECENMVSGDVCLMSQLQEWTGRTFYMDKDQIPIVWMLFGMKSQVMI